MRVAAELQQQPTPSRYATPSPRGRRPPATEHRTPHAQDARSSARRTRRQGRLRRRCASAPRPWTPAAGSRDLAAIPGHRARPARPHSAGQNHRKPLNQARTRHRKCKPLTGPLHMSRWVLAARGSRETWAAGPLRVVTGRRCWRQVCCRCAGRRRDRFQGARWRPGCPAGACGDPGVIAVNGRRARPSGVDDGRVLPVTPCGPWRFAPGYESGGGGDLAGWVLSLSSTPIRFGFPRAVPRAASS